MDTEQRITSSKNKSKETWNIIKENTNKVTDNYLIKNKLGEGTFGTVKRVIDKTTKDEKALKIINKNIKD